MKRNNELFILYLIVLTTGISGMLGQLLLIRELLIVFLGNELTIGFILGNWLIFEALGAFSGKYLGRVEVRKKYSIFLLSFAALLVLNLFLSRGINHTLFNLYPGETANITLVLIQSIIILAPVSFAHGILFPLGSALVQELDDQEIADKVPGLIYLIETIGSLIGGVFFTFCLATRFHSLEISLLILIFSIVCTLFLLKPYGVNLLSKAFLLLLLTIIISLSIFYSSISESLHTVSLQQRWPNEDLYYYENSAHSNYVIAGRNNQFTVYQDGRPSISIPNPDKTLQKDLIHIAAGLHPNPEKVLIVGSGPGGYLEELLLHPVKEVHYVEIDSRLPAILSEIPDDRMRMELTDPAVKIINTDIRRYLNTSDHNYDLIIVALMQPNTLQTNRIFTKQFFELTKNNLSNKGILFFTAPGAPHLYTYEVLPLNACLLRTAEMVFPHVKILPGENTYFFAGKSSLSLNPALINHHLTQRNLSGDFITLDYLANRFDHLKTDLSALSIKDLTVRVNEDLNPAGFYYDTMASVGLYSHRLFSILNYLEKIPFFYIMLFLIVSIYIITHIEDRNIPLHKALNCVIFSSGLTVMALQMLVLFSFQIAVGFLYQMIGLLFAAFMGGNMLGSILGIQTTKKKNIHLVLKKIELKVVLLNPLVILLLLFMQKYTASIHPNTLIILFSLINFTAGALSGSQYPIAAYLKSVNGLDKTGGSLYALDLLGGWVGGTIVALLFFPLIGLVKTIILLGALKLGSLLTLNRALHNS